MSLLRSIRERIQAARLEWDVRRGRKQWGRSSISATVIRADGSVEELGVIAEGKVSFLPGRMGK